MAPGDTVREPDPNGAGGARALACPGTLPAVRDRDPAVERRDCSPTRAEPYASEHRGGRPVRVEFTQSQIAAVREQAAARGWLALDREPESRRAVLWRAYRRLSGLPESKFCSSLITGLLAESGLGWPRIDRKRARHSARASL